MSKRLLMFGAVALVAFLVGIIVWFSYAQSVDKGNSVPEQGREAFEKTRDPIQKFEKDMGQRLDDAKTNGVDLGKEKPVNHEHK